MSKSLRKAKFEYDPLQMKMAKRLIQEYVEGGGKSIGSLQKFLYYEHGIGMRYPTVRYWMVKYEKEMYR